MPYSIPEPVVASTSSLSSTEEPTVWRSQYAQPLPQMREMAKRTRQLVRTESYADVSQSYSFPPSPTSFASSSSSSSFSSRSSSLSLDANQHSRRQMLRFPLPPTADRAVPRNVPSLSSKTEFPSHQAGSQPLWRRRGKFVPSLSLRKRRQRA